MAGVCLGVVSALAYAAFYVISDALLCGKYEADPKDTTTAPSPLTTFAFVGMVNSLWCGCYVALHTGPNWEKEISNPVREAKSAYTDIVYMYLVLMFMFGIHVGSFGYVLKGSGAVSAGVNKALQAISIFAFSAMAYCDDHSDQCLTKMKLLSMGLVLVGILWYAHATSVATDLVEEAALQNEESWQNVYTEDMTPDFLRESYEAFLYHTPRCDGQADQLRDSSMTPRFMRAGDAGLLEPETGDEGQAEFNRGRAGSFRNPVT